MSYNLLPTIKEKLLAGEIFRVVFLGDSITSCEWIHPNWREIIEYVLKMELQKQIKDWRIPSWQIRCINSGLDGSTTSDWINLFDQHVSFYQPSLLIMMGSSNDIRHDVNYKIDPRQHKQNIQTLLEKSLKNIPHVVYATDIPALSPSYSERYSKYRLAAMELFPKDGAFFVDLFKIYSHLNLEKIFTLKSEEDAEENVKAGDIDPAHPNILGNAYIAQIFLKEIFDIPFNPEKFIQDTISQEKYPSYK